MAEPETYFIWHDCGPNLQRWTIETKLTNNGDYRHLISACDFEEAPPAEIVAAWDACRVASGVEPSFKRLRLLPSGEVEIYG